MNCQLVLCPGLNDGNYLRKSLADLSGFYPNIESIACVPIGKTKFRENLFKLDSYTKETALDVINIINDFAHDFFEKHGTYLMYASDEFYLKAGLNMPPAKRYDDFKQIENGVGMCVSLEDEFDDALKSTLEDEYAIKKDMPSISIATGKAAYPLICSLINKISDKIPQLDCKVYQIINEFFGEEITVAGLIVGRDLINQLKDKKLGERLIITADMLESTKSKFLDDITVEQVENELNVKLVPVSNDGYELVSVITDCF